MSYTYDQEHTTLIIEQDKTADGVTPSVLIQMDHPLGPSSAIQVNPEDAPAVALAILEAAGLGPDSTEPTVREAARDLAVYVKSRLKQAEREAEDAKVREFVATIPGVSYLDESEDHWRHLYHAAHKFFQEAA